MGTEPKLYSYRKALIPLCEEKTLKEIQQQKGTNAGLWLAKYLRDQDRADTKEQDRTKGSNRSALIAEVALIPTPAAYKQFYARWTQTLEDMDARTGLAEVKGRMAVGLGAESVLETSIALHHIYGVPYIPGSALKGLAASYARQRLEEAVWSKDSDAYKVIFGDTKEAGYITFFDALLVVKPDEAEQPTRVLYQDTITVHHPDYYQGKSAAPSDWDSPTPIPFLSATGTYLVALAAPDLDEKDEWIKRTFEILGHALQEMGIGAKTSSGYGRMKLTVKEDKKGQR